MPKPDQSCPYFGCGYPEGECSGDCLTPRAGFGRPPSLVLKDCSRLRFPTVSELAASLHASPGRLDPGPAVILPIDAANPDPATGDPWPYHLCMPGVEWRQPLGPVLRPDSPVSCPPCSHRRRQACPPRPAPSGGAVMSFPYWALPGLAWAAFFLALIWRDVVDDLSIDRWDLLFLSGIIFGPLAFSAIGRFLP